jgi:hypothetical protein
MEKIIAALSLVTLAACGGSALEAESLEAGLSIAYVSGHLGSEQACPILKALSRASCDGPCEPSPCDNGAVLVRVKNISDHAVPIRVERIDLLLDGEQEIPIREVASTDGHHVPEVRAEQDVTLRILFPRQQSFSGHNSASLRLIFSGEDGEKLEIITPELSLAPLIAT